jgi:hypothetical protein
MTDRIDEIRARNGLDREHNFGDGDGAKDDIAWLLAQLERLQKAKRAQKTQAVVARTVDDIRADLADALYAPDATRRIYDAEDIRDALTDIEWLLERVRRLELALRVADARWASLIVMSGVLGLDGDIRGPFLRVLRGVETDDDVRALEER